MAALSKTEKKAAMDALLHIINNGEEGGSGVGDGPAGPAPSKEFAEAWNKIMAKYDNEATTEADLQDLLKKVMSGDLSCLD